MTTEHVTLVVQLTEYTLALLSAYAFISTGGNEYLTVRCILCSFIWTAHRPVLNNLQIFAYEQNTLNRVSCTGGGGGGIPALEILKLSTVIILAIYMLLSMCHQNVVVPDCVRSNLRGCKFKIFLGGHAPRPP